MSRHSQAEPLPQAPRPCTCPWGQHPGGREARAQDKRCPSCLASAWTRCPLLGVLSLRKRLPGKQARQPLSWHQLLKPWAQMSTHPGPAARGRAPQGPQVPVGRANTQESLRDKG